MNSAHHDEWRDFVDSIPVAENDSLWMTAGDFFALSQATKDALKAADIYYVGELIQRKEQDLVNDPNFGPNAVAEIRKALDNLYLTLDTEVDWPPNGFD